MIRKIIEINEELCNGCGACATACHEGAIAMVNGKAKLIRDDYCDGLGDCLPTCPTGAITFVCREAAAYDEAAVKANLANRPSGGCPGSAPKTLRSLGQNTPADYHTSSPSALTNWPVQIKLAPLHAPYFDGANLLIAADCTAYAYANFHHQFMEEKVCLIGCPKLDSVDYSEKLTAILRDNAIHSVTVVRMEVPCCGGLEMAVRKAVANSEKDLDVTVVTIGTDGSIL